MKRAQAKVQAIFDAYQGALRAEKYAQLSVSDVSADEARSNAVARQRVLKDRVDNSIGKTLNERAKTARISGLKTLYEDRERSVVGLRM